MDKDKKRSAFVRMIDALFAWRERRIPVPAAQDIPSDSTFPGMVRRTSVSRKAVRAGSDLCGPVLDRNTHRHDAD